MDTLINLNEMSDIEKMAKIWQIQLNLEYNNPKKNVRLSFKDIGAFCEHLAIDFLPGYSGGGSGGMGFDLVNIKTKKAIEVKSCCTIQNAKCSECGAKFNDLFLNHCPDCNKNKFKKIYDSRFGINAKETLEQYEKNIFGGFILCHISLKKHYKEEKTLEILVEWFSIDFDDEPDIKDIRLKYFENQRDYGRKDNNNLLPNSFDFYKLCPLKLEEDIISINYENLNKNPDVKRCSKKYYPRVDLNKLTLKTNEEKILFKNLKTYDVKTKTADSKDFTLNIPYRNKSLGKERGDTRTNLYEKLTKN